MVFRSRFNAGENLIKREEGEKAMKKAMKSTILIALISLLFCGTVSAEDANLPKDEKKISTLILLKQNWIKPEQEQDDGFFCEGITLYWHHKKNIGLGIDIDLIPKTDFQRYRAYFTYNIGPWYALAGVSTDSVGRNYTQAGAWYFNKHGLTEVFVDQRLYVATDGNSDTYSDLFVEILHPIAEGITAGVNASYDHWFSSEQHNWWMAGPVVYFNDLLGKGWSPYVRVAYESDIKAGQENNNAIDFRVGLKITF